MTNLIAGLGNNYRLIKMNAFDRLRRVKRLNLDTEFI